MRRKKKRPGITIKCPRCGVPQVLEDRQAWGLDETWCWSANCAWHVRKRWVETMRPT